jgi:dihydropteroate synthase
MSRNQGSWTLRAGRHNLELSEKSLIMGVLNVTPDSFSDAGRYLSPENALSRAREMVEEGAHIIDVGGESSRPFAEPVSPEEEKRRVLPVIKALADELTIPVSIDSYHPEVVREAIEAGASIINDISGLGDSRMRELAAQSGLPVVLMHMKGTPRNMQKDPHYVDVVREITTFFNQRMRLAIEAGVSEKQLILDPGIGFGKTPLHNLQILGRLEEFAELGRPLLIGTSRKSFIGALQGTEVDERLMGSLASVVAARMKGVALFRVHDVRESRLALEMVDAILGSS